MEILAFVGVLIAIVLLSILSSLVTQYYSGRWLRRQRYGCTETLGQYIANNIRFALGNKDA